MKEIFLERDNRRMDKPVNSICRSANYHIRSLRHVRWATSADVANSIAFAIVGARLDYCNSLLLGTWKTNIVKLQRPQNSTARVVTRTRKFDSIIPVLQRLHWLPIQSRRTYKIALLTCKALHTGQPEYLASLPKWYEFYSHPTIVSTSTSRSFWRCTNCVRPSRFQRRSPSNLEQSFTRRYWRFYGKHRCLFQVSF